MPPDHVLAIDQGTTSTRAMLFDREARMVSVAQRELPQHYPRAGWVEHDAEDIWRDTLAVLQGGDRRIGRRARSHRGDRHHQPARNGRRLGPLDGRADPPRHRLAGPPDGGPCARAQGRRDGRRGPSQDRAAARPLFLGHEAGLDPRQCRGCARHGPNAASWRSARSTASCCGD